MRIYKSVKKNSEDELKQEVGQLRQEGWQPGPLLVNIDSLYPHQCRLWKDLNREVNRKVESR